MNSFNPEDYDSDIVLVEMVSQGRAKGFKVVDEYSALGDEVITGRIAKRMRGLLNLIEGKNDNILIEANTRLEDEIEEMRDDNRVISSELSEANVRIREHEKTSASYDELLSMVNEVLSDVYADSFDDLDSAVRALVDEYDDLLEETEDED